MPQKLVYSTLWLLDQTHIVVTSITALAFLKTRSAHVAYFIVGAVAVNTLAKLSKNVIRQDRPSVTIDDEGQDDSDPATIARKQRHPKRKVKRTYGMPSTHSTSISFFMAYLLLSIPLYATSIRLPSERTHLIAKNVMMQLAIFAWGSAILWSRVRLGYHTLAQVAVGAGLGLVWGIGWRWAWDHLVKNGANVPVWAAHAYKSLGLATGPSLQQQGQWTIDKAFELIGLS